mgnify:CR=1 FL=1
MIFVQKKSPIVNNLFLDLFLSNKTNYLFFNNSDFNRRIFMDPNKNSGMFKSLHNVNIERMIEIGTEEQRRRVIINLF